MFVRGCSPGAIRPDRDATWPETGDLDDYLQCRFQQEKHRNHDARYQPDCELAA